MLLEKLDITYCGTLNTKSPEASCRISPKTKDHAEKYSISVAATSFFKFHEGLSLFWPG